MELLFDTMEERQRIEIYNEYLQKIPKLLLQLEAVERMYEKALMEEEMLQGKDDAELSVNLYKEKLASIKQQCQERSKDIRQQCHLIFELKGQVEAESSVIRKLQE